MKNHPYPSFEDIYETVNGMREKEYCVPWIEDAFAEGKVCDKRYEEMRQAYLRICDRLGVGDEDEDLNTIIRCMESIQKEIAKDIYKLSTQMAEHAVGTSIHYGDVYNKFSSYK